MANQTTDRETWPYGIELLEERPDTLPPPPRAPQLDDDETERSAASTQRIRMGAADPNAITQPSLPAPVSSRRDPPLETRYSFVAARRRQST